MLKSMVSKLKIIIKSKLVMNQVRKRNLFEDLKCIIGEKCSLAFKIYYGEELNHLAIIILTNSS